jgi:hypothetical protein
MKGVEWGRGKGGGECKGCDRGRKVERPCWLVFCYVPVPSSGKPEPGQALYHRPRRGVTAGPSVTLPSTSIVQLFLRSSLSSS